MNYHRRFAGTLSGGVADLDSALDAYWRAHSFREEQAAYHEILLFGGRDGYAPHNAKIRVALARVLRRLALWIEPK